MTGILIHSGNANAGHYYSYIKETEGKNKDKWYEFNDTYVTNFDPNRIKTECFGGDVDKARRGDFFYDIISTKSRNAYMLFY